MYPMLLSLSLDLDHQGCAQSDGNFDVPLEVMICAFTERVEEH